jgi:hypothetical protein
VVNDHSDDEDVLLLIADKSCVVIRVVLVTVCCELILHSHIFTGYFIYIYSCVEMSGNKKDTKTNVSNTTKKNEEEESAELVRITFVIFSS